MKWADPAGLKACARIMLSRWVTRLTISGSEEVRWRTVLLAPGEVRKHDWPLGVQQFGGRSTLAITYIGIPALDGNTWPLRWYSEPTATAPFVEAGRLVAGV
ncbi:hypothetical protein OG800_23650 [Streptomyces sp. NBC_00445]|uniref:hypothetical protein n=1 Tax=Streptomyces sp. NBC_00445 TaxID=2975745 RepID=UPI002E1F9DC2